MKTSFKVAFARENGRPVRAIAGHLPDDHRFSFSRKDGMDVGVCRPPGTFNRWLTAAPECRWRATQLDLPPPRFNPNSAASQDIALFKPCIFEWQGCTRRSVMCNPGSDRRRPPPVCNVHSGADESECRRIDQMLCFVEEGAVRFRPPASHPPDCNVEL